MSMASQFESIAQKRETITAAASLYELVNGLRSTERDLRASVEAEETRTQIRDQSNPHYSTLARALRARADNLRLTIDILEARRAAA